MQFSLWPAMSQKIMVVQTSAGVVVTVTYDVHGVQAGARGATGITAALVGATEALVGATEALVGATEELLEQTIEVEVM